MSRVKEAQDIVDLIDTYTTAAPQATISIKDGILISILLDIMMSLAVISDSVNKEEKNGR